MYIAFVTPSLKLGGYEKVILFYANELTRRGYKVDILCGNKCGDLLNQVDEKVTIYDFHARLRSYLFPLVKYLKNTKVDYLYTGFRSYNAVGVLAKHLSQSKVKVIVSQHEFKKNNIASFLLSRVTKKADYFVANEDKVADCEARSLHISRERFYIANNPVIDTDHPIPDVAFSWGDEIDRIPVICSCGRLAYDKRKDLSIYILSEIRKSRDVRLVFIGDGPEKESLESLARKLNIEDSVSFIGYVDSPVAYMKKCSLFLHTAAVEPFGNVVVEAMYAGLPVCVSNCSGPLHIIENGKYGVDLGNIDDETFVVNSAKTILDILDGKISFDGAKQRAEEFSVKKATDQLIDICDMYL